MRERGYVVGRNLQLDVRYTQAEAERIPTLINELVLLHPEIIVALGPPNAIAVHNAVPAIPLVFIGISDPVAVGLVESLAHPGGNVTGFASAVPEGFTAKQLQLLKAVVPTAQRIAVLINPTTQTHQRERTKLPDYARQLALELFPVEASKPEQLEAAFETAHTNGADAIHVWGDPLVGREGQKIADLAIKYRLPSMYFFRETVAQGGLMSYGPNMFENWRGSATYVDKILKGANPGELPVAQSTRYNLVINLRTEKALGLTIPPDLLAQAAELIE
jgi:putative ABC transport system substrate-binding protein